MNNLILAVFFTFAIMYVGVQCLSALNLIERRMSEQVERASR